MRRITKLEARAEGPAAHPPAPAQEPRPQRSRQRHHRRLHERRQVDAAQPAHRRRRAGRGPAVRHARPDHPPPVAARRRAGAADRHGRLRPPAAPRARRGVQEHARGGGRGRPARPRRRRQRARSRGADRRRARPCWPRSTPTQVPELLVFNKADLAPEEAKRLVADPRGLGRRLGARTGEGIDESPAHAVRPAAGAATVVELLVPYDRGDVLAAVHREGEVVSTAHDDGGVRVRARLADAVGRPSRRVRGRAGLTLPVVGSMAGRMTSADPARLRPPALPVRPPRSAQAARRGASTAASSTSRSARRATRRRPPCVAALATSDTERGYPPSIGTAALRTAASGWMAPPLRRRRPASARSAACVGTKEFVGDAAAVAAAAHARPRHRALPGHLLPDLRDGRHPRRLPCRAGAAPTRAGGLDLDAIDPGRRGPGAAASG